MIENRKYCFAGIEIEVLMPEERFYTNEYRLTPFRTDSLKSPHVMRFQWVEKLSEPQGRFVNQRASSYIYNNGSEQICYFMGVSGEWENSLIRVSHKGKCHEVEVKKTAFLERIPMKTVLDCMNIEQMLAQVNGFILHSSYIAIDGNAILFTAPSGMGKSTQAELWKQFRGAEIINGDRAAVRWKINEGDDCVVAEGVPFAGSSEYCLKRSLPIRAIVTLEQSPSTFVSRLYGYEAFSNIWKGTYMGVYEQEEMEKCVEVAMHVAKTVPVFHLSCTPDESAVIALENALKEEKNI